MSTFHHPASVCVCKTGLTEDPSARSARSDFACRLPLPTSRREHRASWGPRLRYACNPAPLGDAASCPSVRNIGASAGRPHPALVIVATRTSFSKGKRLAHPLRRNMHHQVGLGWDGSALAGGGAILELSDGGQDFVGHLGIGLPCGEPCVHHLTLAVDGDLDN